jgi:1,4-alpha-glucan branching enzyme
MAGLYDAELFGHWWFEGVAWLKDVLRRLAASETVNLSGAARYVREHPPEDAIALAAGSWGVDGNDSTWKNAKNAWMWPKITEAQRRMGSLAATYGTTSGAVRAALEQLGRELLLLESSDWPYLVTTGQAFEYAERRFTQHAERFDALAAMIESRDVSAAYLADLQERDKLFPDMRVQDFE